jgi:nicotinate-nucleotide pyrophosphorylase (carboxylating)
MNELDDQLNLRLQLSKSLLPHDLQHPAVFKQLILALAEDLSEGANLSEFRGRLAEGDVTSMATISTSNPLSAYIRAKASGVVAGLPVVEVLFNLVDPTISYRRALKDRDVVQKGQVLAQLQGDGRALLAGERTALNFLGRMSGFASMTYMFVQAVKGTKAVILDTRKTAPGLRYLDKYAVRMGGGQNHRAGLFDMVLIKDNHITGAGGITPAVQRVREMYGQRYAIEVEVKNLAELEEAINLKVERIMLDNMDLENMRRAVQVANGRVPLEASGNVILNNVRQIAETGVNFISSGALTHSAPTLDISMKIG